VSGGLWEESQVEKITKTIKIRMAWTVSDGSYVEEHIPNKGEKAGQVSQLSECTASGSLWEE
jgi:hypothetical protein